MWGNQYKTGMKLYKVTAISVKLELQQDGKRTERVRFIRSNWRLSYEAKEKENAPQNNSMAVNGHNYESHVQIISDQIQRAEGRNTGRPYKSPPEQELNPVLEDNVQ
jgi:hypothetical protein